MYNADRRSQEFMDDVHSLLRAIEANKHDGFMCCPCAICKNLKSGFMLKESSFTLVEVGFHAKLYLLDEARRNRGCNERR